MTWPPPRSHASASAALVALLHEPESEPEPRRALIASYVSHYDSPGLSLIKANKKTQELREYIDDVSHALEDFKEKIDIALAKRAKTQFPGRLKNALAAPAVSEDTSVRHPKAEQKRVLYEFCCDKDSELGRVSDDHNIKCVRLSKESCNLFDPFQVEKLIKDIHSTPGCHLHASLPCTVWSTWQHINCRKKGAAYMRTLERRRMHSLKLFSHFVQAATAVRQGGGTISFEWPRYCLGWAQQSVLDFISKFNMSSVLIDGCAFGMNHKGEPIKKQWRIITDHKRLVRNCSSIRLCIP